MATKSKMSTSTTRKVTTKRTGPPTGPPNNPPNGGTKETREQYEKRWDDYQKLYQENKDYASQLATYKKQTELYNKLAPKGPYTSLMKTKALTDEEIKLRNQFESKNNPNYVPYKRGTRVEAGVSVDPKTGDWIGKFNKDPMTGREYTRSESGRAVTVYELPQYERPTLPKKPGQLPRQPYNPEYEPKLALKKPGTVGSSDSKSVKIIQPKLKTNVASAIEKPEKVKVPRRNGGVTLVKQNVMRKNRQTGPFKNLRQDVKSKITDIKISGTTNQAERKAAKEANKSTRAARRTFGKEERLATGYLKNQGIIEGDTKKEMKAGIRSYAKSNMAAKKADKLSGSFKERKAEGIYESRKQAVKTAKKAVKYVSRLEKGKIRSFTPEALGKTKEVSAKVQTTTVGKGKNKKTIGVAVVPTKKSTRMQAGRYVY